MTPRIGVLALQGDVREHLRALNACGADAVAVRGESGLSGLEGLVIPGGESTTMSILAEREGLLTPLRDFSRSGRPCFGSCAGMIFLADRIMGGRADQQTMGGLDVTAQRNAFGRQVDSFEIDLDIPAIDGAPFPAVFIRAPAIVDVGPQVEVLARVEDRVVAVRQGHLMATAFHPELTSDVRIHRYFVGMVTAGNQGGDDVTVESTVRERA